MIVQRQLSTAFWPLSLIILCLKPSHFLYFCLVNHCFYWILNLCMILCEQLCVSKHIPSTIQHGRTKGRMTRCYLCNPNDGMGRPIWLLMQMWVSLGNYGWLDFGFCFSLLFLFCSLFLSAIITLSASSCQHRWSWHCCSSASKALYMLHLQSPQGHPSARSSK